MVKFTNFIFFYSYDKMIKLKPNEKKGWEKKGNILKEVNRYDEAL